jgi:hypothetical protein
MSTPVSHVHRRQNVRKTLLLGSFLLFPVTFCYLSPYLIIMGAGERTASGSMVAFGVMTLTALVLGRLFCGWVCPAGGTGQGAVYGAEQEGKQQPKLDAVVCLGPVDGRCGPCDPQRGQHQARRRPISDRSWGLADDCRRHGTLHHFLRRPRAAVRPVVDGGQAWVLPPCLLDGTVHDDWKARPQRPPSSRGPVARRHACVCRLPCLHGRMPDEPRRPDNGPGSTNGEQRMHPVRHLCRRLPPQCHPM